MSRQTNEDLRQFEQRKRDHLRHALDPSNQALGASGLEGVRLVHEALPELALAEVSIASAFLGRRLATPFYVAGMTAGHADAPELNERLAIACERRGWIMGVGSQRRQLSERADFGPDAWKRLRERAPSLTLIANLGISQLVGTPVGKIVELARAIEAQAIAIHLNALQECLQPEGTPNLRGAFAALEALCEGSPVPIVVKETGCGMSAETLARLSRLKLAAIDVSGLGGTHWGRIEGARSEGGSLQAQAAETFAEWGIPTTVAVQNARATVSAPTEIWASGGVRSGLDAAKLIALGAHRAGYAKPALEAALSGQLEAWMERQEFELKVALFCTGCDSPESLRTKESAWTPSTS